MDVEERNRQIKMKINKYKQTTGSDSRLEKDYNSKVRKNFSKIRSGQVLLHKNDTADVEHFCQVDIVF